jgi:uncharacterized protein
LLQSGTDVTLLLRFSLIENCRRLRQIVVVKLTKLLALFLLAAVFAGCHKSSTPAPPPDQPALPTHAQPKLRTMKIFLGPEVLDTELALTPEEEMTGMMFRTNIPESDSMLFVLPYPQRASFWMTNCPESLSAAYISPDGVIKEIHHLEKNDNVPVVATNDNIQFVLETKDGWFARHHIGTGTLIRTERGSLAETFLQNRQ